MITKLRHRWQEVRSSFWCGRFPRPAHGRRQFDDHGWSETGTQLVLTTSRAPWYPVSHAKRSAISTRRAVIQCPEPIGRQDAPLPQRRRPIRGTSCVLVSLLRGCMNVVLGLQSMLVWAEDRALLGSSPNADPGAKTGAGGGRDCSTPAPNTRYPRLRDWHESDKPSRQDAATSGAGGPDSVTSAHWQEFQFTVNQDKGT
jgi:hypothetical protein